MKKRSSFIFALFIPCLLSAQELSLESCQSAAQQNYPLVQQYGLIEQSANYTLQNINLAYLPQLSISAKATYQSDVIKLPIVIPGMTIPEMSPYQFQAVAELGQVIWDGGVIAAQKQTAKASSEVEKRKWEVDLYALRDRVNQLYFGVLLLDGQLEQVHILKQELTNHYNKVNSLVQNGIGSSTDLDAIKVEQLNVMQQETQLAASRRSLIQVLSAFIGQEITESAVFALPLMGEIRADKEIKRPELQLLEAQNKVLGTQKELLTSGNLPKIGAFIQGGYGKPGLNMLSNDFSFFYIGGLKLTWNISGLYGQKNNVRKIEVNQKNIEVQKETFLFNLSLFTTQQRNEMDKLTEIIRTDDAIVELKSKIKRTTESKVENGTSTVTDLLRELHAENAAKQNRLLHQVQLYAAYYQYINNNNF